MKINIKVNSGPILAPEFIHSAIKKKTLKKLVITQEIDVSTICEPDQLLTMIVAGVLNAMEGERPDPKFYRILSDLTTSIDGIVTSGLSAELSSLEYISKNQSGLKLIDNLDSFFKAVLKLESFTNKKKIVIPITNLSLNLSGGFGVIEAIKKYLVSNKIQLVVVDSMESIEMIIRNYFLRLLNIGPEYLPRNIDNMVKSYSSGVFII